MDHIKVMYLCQVPIFIGKRYKDFVTCDVVDMDKCHILLGRQWQHDVDATHKKKRIYILTWKSKRVAMRPISSTLKSTKEKVSKLVSLCNQVNRNSRSSFEEEGIDVGRQSHKSILTLD